MSAEESLRSEVEERPIDADSTSPGHDDGEQCGHDCSSPQRDFAPMAVEEVQTPPLDRNALISIGFDEEKVEWALHESGGQMATAFELLHGAHSSKLPRHCMLCTQPTRLPPVRWRRRHSSGMTASSLPGSVSASTGSVHRFCRGAPGWTLWPGRPRPMSELKIHRLRKGHEKLMSS